MLFISAISLDKRYVLIYHVRSKLPKSIKVLYIMAYCPTFTFQPTNFSTQKQNLTIISRTEPIFTH